MAYINSLQISLFMFKVHHRLLQLRFTKSFFYWNSEIPQYNTRSSENYYLKSANTNIKQVSINCKCPNVWNSITVTIRSLDSIKKFKRQIIDSLLQKYYNNTRCKNKLWMFLICVMFLCSLCILVIIRNFMCCIGLCSNCFWLLGSP